MKNGLKRIKNFIKLFGNDDVAVDIRSLYLVIIYCILVSIIYTVIFALSSSERPLIYISTGVLLFFVLVLYLLGRFDEVSLFHGIYMLKDCLAAKISSQSAILRQFRSKCKYSFPQAQAKNVKRC